MPIRHPYFFNRQKIHMTVNCLFEGPTINGLPDGLGYVGYVHKGDVHSFDSFKGIVHVKQGQVTNNPTLFTCGDGKKFYFTHMIDNRPFGLGYQFSSDDFDRT